MRPNRFFQILRIALALAPITLGVGNGARAAVTETVLHNFTDTGLYNPSSLVRDAAGNLYGIAGNAIFELQQTPSGGSKVIKLHTFPGSPVPVGPLAVDAAGDLFGVTESGGIGFGQVFKLTPGPKGLQESAIYSFAGAGASDGASPSGGLIFDSAGNLYGVTKAGGSLVGNCSPYGCGTVFQLSSSSGSWTETVLYSFTFGSDGSNPFGRLIFDGAGKLYGTTQGAGAVFQLSPVSGSWTESVLHNFGTGGVNDGLAIDAEGNVFGTTQSEVFELSLSPGGKYWKETVLYDFQGEGPADLISDMAGNLYGITNGGGNGFGTLFELTPAGGGIWNLNTLFSFTVGWGGASPSGLLMDAAGNFFAASSQAGVQSGIGEVLKISPGPKGVRKATVLLRGDSKDGLLAGAGLISDSAGSLYGTTTGGGLDGFGTGFKLSPIPGGWKESTLYSFTGGKDGGQPEASLTLDAVGNLFGTTQWGGKTTNCVSGCGTVFELSPTPRGGWRETVLYAFKGGANDGAYPVANLIFDAAGNLFGTTSDGGIANCRIYYNTYGCGTIFELSPSPGGGWKETVLFSFTGGSDGGRPLAGLIFDGTGNLYGTTLLGPIANPSYWCPFGCGTVFELSSVSGVWKESTLYSFTGGSDGGVLQSGLVFDTAGNLYGTTAYGGYEDPQSFETFGTVFKLTPTPSGWTENAIYSFLGFPSSDGYIPTAGLIFDHAGNLYGTTALGGGNSWGTVFELSPSPGGNWTETILHTFGLSDGGNPQAGLIMDAAGNLYGTTTAGGSPNNDSTFCQSGCGTVFEVSGR